MTPVWLLDAVAAVMLAVAAVSAVRLGAARPWRRGAGPADSDAAHLLMATAMAGMLAPGLRTLPATAWEVVFGVLGAWFALKVARDARANGVRALAVGHCAPHLVHSCAMAYMFLAIPAAGAGGMGGMPGMPGTGPAMMTLRYPALALAFAFILAGYSIWDIDQVSARRYRLEAPRVSLAGLAPGGAVPELAGPGLAVMAGAGSASAVDPGGGPRSARGSAGGEGAAASSAVPGQAGSRAFLLSPAITIGCRVAMGVAMAFMLVSAI
jgi:hypothetical protein